MGGKVSMVFNSNCFPKMKDFSRLGALQAVTYTLNMVVSKKWREIDTLFLHTTIYSWIFRKGRFKPGMKE